MAEQNERWDRIERGIEYLIQSMAKHDGMMANQERLIAKHEDRLDEHSERLDRIETVLEEAAQTQKQLLIAQVVFVDETRKALDELKQQTAHTDENLSALIHTVDAIIRGQAPPPPIQ